MCDPFVKLKVVHKGMKMTIIQKDVIFAMPRMLQDRIRRSVALGLRFRSGTYLKGVAFQRLLTKRKNSGMFKVPSSFENDRFGSGT